MEKFLSEVLYDVQSGKVQIPEAIELLLREMGRGDRTIIVDEHLDGLDDELARLNYTVRMVRKGLKDHEILPTLNNRVFVTQNYSEFEDYLDEYKFGLIAVKHAFGDFKQLAQRVKDAMMKAQFNNNLKQIINV
jgi:hypothetical protein